ncbi:MAG: hypothetical protein JW724_03050 [Candidatus Altiarchaeota archaeon]|nr:hypothetical protein [Candidatus Altiarchaeota archaeon]
MMASGKFRNVKWHKRIESIVGYWTLDRDIDVLPYTPEEFTEKKNSRCIVRQAAEEGVLL